MQWIPLTDEKQLTDIISQSAERPQVIFKHSTRCSISAVALQRLQKETAPADFNFYMLDLLAYRAISNKVAERFGVNHESPQVLVIRNGACVFDESHLGISMHDIIDSAKAA